MSNRPNDEICSKLELIHDNAGWHINIYWGYRAWAGLVSESRKTKKETMLWTKKYLEEYSPDGLKLKPIQIDRRTKNV